MHGAKGLEFPIVILAGLNVSPPNPRDAVLWNPDGTFEVRVGQLRKAPASRPPGGTTGRSARTSSTPPNGYGFSTSPRPRP